MARPNRNTTKYEAKTAEQQRAAEAIQNNAYTFLCGDSGTGKTYCAAGCAVDWLRSNKSGRIVILRPAVGAGEHLGYLPGTADEKIEPFLKPIVLALHDYDMVDDDAKSTAQKHALVDYQTFEHLRGMTFDNAFVIVEEVQNATVLQLKLVLTRLGQNAKMVLTGDTDQSDLGKHNGLSWAIKFLHADSVEFVNFTAEVSNRRHPSIPEILRCFREADTTSW